MVVIRSKNYGQALKQATRFLRIYAMLQVTNIIRFGIAASLAKGRMESEFPRLKILRARFIEAFSLEQNQC